MNKESELAYFRMFVIRPYVSEVMTKIQKEEGMRKRLCRCRNQYKTIDQYYQYKQDGHITYSLYCKQCLHKTSKKTKK